MPHEKSPQNTIRRNPDHDAVHAALGLSKVMGPIRLKWINPGWCSRRGSVLVLAYRLRTRANIARKNELLFRLEHTVRRLRLTTLHTHCHWDPQSENGGHPEMKIRAL